MKKLTYKQHKQLNRLTGNDLDRSEVIIDYIERHLDYLSTHNKNYTKDQDYRIYELCEIFKILTNKSNIEIE